MGLKFISRIKKSLAIATILASTVFAFANNPLTVKVGYFDFPRYQEGMSDDVHKSGYAYEYLQKIAAYTGWNYEYVYGERAELLQKIKSKEIDLLVGLSKDIGGTGDFTYSFRPTIVSTYYLFQSANSETVSIYKPESFEKAKIGVLKDSDGALKLDEYLKDKNLKCNLIEYTDYVSFKNAFFNGDFDAFVSTDLELSSQTYVSVVDTIGNHPLYAIISNRNIEVAKQFNEAQEKIRADDPLYLDYLHSKYFDETIANLISNKKDFEWIKHNDTVTIGYIDNYLPFCTTTSGGQVTGLLKDIVSKIELSYFNKNVNVSYKVYTQYPEAMKELKDGKIDVLFPFYGDLWVAEQHKFQLSDTVYMLSMVLVTDRKTDYKDVTKIAVSKRSPLQIFYVDSLFPNAQLEYFETIDECITAVKDKKVDATVSNRFKATSYLNSNSSLLLDMKDLREECPISFAVRRGSVDLLKLINGCLIQVDTDYINNSVFVNSYNTQKITVMEFISQNAMFFLLIMFILFMAIIFGADIIIVRVKKRNEVVRMQKAQLEDMLRKQIVDTATIRSVSKLYIALYYINMKDYEFTEMYISDEVIRASIGRSGNALIKFDSMNKDLVIPEHYELMRSFNDLTTLKQRLGNRMFISQDFRGPHFGWCEAFFIVPNNTTSEDLSHVIYAVRSVEKEKELLVRSSTDELTGCLNRRAYEEHIKDLSKEKLSEDLVIVSLDLNGLKNANDDIGHDAGDELIVGAARCIEKAFGTYGRVYRIGGDEFIAVIEASEKEFSDIQHYFDELTSEWKGKLVERIAISYGSASVREFPDSPITEIAKNSDKRMYQNKEYFYSHRGVDRRSNQIAFETLRVTYTKILKVNLAKDEYTVMMMDENERTEEKGFRSTLSEWLKAFAEAGLVHPEDKEKYLERTDLKYMKDYFKKENKILTIRYRRMTNNVYQDSIMDIIPVKNYSESNQTVFLYVKNI